ncbi:MAG: lipopolysaccharide heptosyltransferase family protein [Ignavibacteriae bacterium]|nr:MAG: lipopolysaccharide heptosyltransferase family protein [Ignavibacteriota bacterium]
MLKSHINIAPEKILVIRTDRIGDVILTLPVIDTLKSNFPNAEIDFLVNKRVAELVQDYPNINKVHTIEKENIKDIHRIAERGKYDLAIVVRPVFATALGLFMAGVKYRLGTGYRWYSFLFNIKHHQHRKHALKHELEYNLDMLDELNCKRPDKITLKLDVNEPEMHSMKKKLEQHSVPLDKPYIIIHPGSLGSALTWKKENFIKLIELLQANEKINYNILLSGTQTENELLKDITNKSGGKTYIVNNLNLKELAALLKQAKMFISNSTGPIHIAAAVGTFVIGFYSPIKVESETRWGPYTDYKKIFTPSDTAEGDIMDEIKPEEVYKFIENKLRI